MFGIFCSDSKEEIVSLIWANSIDSLTCGLPVFILLLSYCKQVGFYPGFLDVFDNFLVPMNYTVLLDFQLHFVFIVDSSLDLFPIIHHIHFPSPVFLKSHQEVKWS